MGRAGRAAGYLLLLASTAPAATAQAQEPERPTIGVALSGGSARGIAHIGVLRALEDLRVPIDVIAGTSMGAIIGGLYASGLSPDEIQDALANVDWDQILSDKPPRTILDFRRREEGRRYLFEIELGLKKGRVLLPGGLIAGQPLAQLLRRHTFHATGVESFDSLPIPFRAVATDIDRGEAVVLDRGDLARALRASMAVPVVFSPVEIDGRLLVDGGLRNNLPVDVTRAMGADVVIAVDVSVPLAAREAPANLLGISNRVVTMLARTGVDQQLEQADVRIVPDLEGFGLADYRQEDEMVSRGGAAAWAVADTLRRYALEPEAYARYRAGRRARREIAGRVDAVRLELPPWLDERLVVSRIRTRAGDPIDPEGLSEDVERVYALGDFERVDWTIVETKGRREVVVRTEPKPWAPDYLHFGLRLVTDSGAAGFRTGLATFEGVIDLTRTRLNSRGAEWRTDVVFGQVLGISTELYQPIDFGGRWFVAPSVRMEDAEQPVYQSGRLVAEYGIFRALAGVDLGHPLGRSAEARIGVRGGWIDAEVDAGEAELESFEGSHGALVARLVVDRLDNVNFPHRGVLVESDVQVAREALSSDRDYERVSGRAAGYATAGRHTGFARIELGSSLGADLPAHDEFLLGGLLSLGGIGQGELRGDAFAAGRVGYYARLFRLPPASRAVYVGGWVEAGDAWDRDEDVDLGDWTISGTAAIGADTGIGPVFLAYARARGHGGRIHVAVGATF